MPDTLKELCQQYVDIISHIECTSDRLRLQQLEEERVRLHNLILDAFHEAGILYTDRQDVERQAWNIAYS